MLAIVHGTYQICIIHVDCLDDGGGLSLIGSYITTLTWPFTHRIILLT